MVLMRKVKTLMPMFDFKCLTCSNIFETLVMRPVYNEQGKMLGLECPHCGNKDTEKFIKEISVGTNFQLKGDGWYADGYASKKGNN